MKETFIHIPSAGVYETMNKNNQILVFYFHELSGCSFMKFSSFQIFSDTVFYNTTIFKFIELTAARVFSWLVTLASEVRFIELAKQYLPDELSILETRMYCSENMDNVCSLKNYHEENNLNKDN